MASVLIVQPGMCRGGLDQSALGVATCVGHALEATAQGVSSESSLGFRVQSRGTVSAGSTEAEHARIERLGPDGAAAILDVFVVRDVQLAVDRRAELPASLNLTRLAFQLLGGISKLRGLAKMRGSGRRRAIAASWAIVVLATLCVHFVLLTVSVLIAIIQLLLESSGDSPSILHSSVFPWLAASLLILNTFVLPYLPKRWREGVAEAASGWMVLVGYLDGEVKREEVAAGVPNLIHSWAAAGTEYDRVFLAGYSMGSLLALDTAFDYGATGFPIIEKLSGLVTIGCPFDVVNLYWPDYFHHRIDEFGLSKHWINVAIHGDPISSHSEDGPAMELVLRDGSVIRPSVTLTEESWGERRRSGVWMQLLTAGVRKLHGSYWDSASGQPGCWRVIVPHLLESCAVFTGDGENVPEQPTGDD